MYLVVCIAGIVMPLAALKQRVRWAFLEAHFIAGIVMPLAEPSPQGKVSVKLTKEV